MCYGINCLLFRNEVVNGSGISTLAAHPIFFGCLGWNEFYEDSSLADYDKLLFLWDEIELRDAVTIRFGLAFGVPGE